MLITCWSVKGGVGTSVVAAALALAGSRRHVESLLVDLAGDQPAVLGMAEPSGPGLAGWSRAGERVPPDALERLSAAAGPCCRLLPRGLGPLDADRIQVLASLLASDPRLVVIDAGCLRTSPENTAAAELAARSLLVVRPCLVGLSHCRALPSTPTGVVVVRDPGRALSSRDVASTVGAPVVAELAVDPAVGRAVDAGLRAGHLPRRFVAAVRSLS